MITHFRQTEKILRAYVGKRIVLQVFDGSDFRTLRGTIAQVYAGHIEVEHKNGFEWFFIPELKRFETT